MDIKRLFSDIPCEHPEEQRIAKITETGRVILLCQECSSIIPEVLEE